MGAETGISWTESTWNFIRGCSMEGTECLNCYAMRMASRFCDEGQPYYGVAEKTGHGGKWTGKVAFIEDKLDQPLRWQRPRTIFVNSTSDLFHENLDINIIKQGFEVMAAADWHIYQILTKRSARMAEEMSKMVLSNGRNLGKDPLHHVWMGVSVGHEKSAQARFNDLVNTPAKRRFISAEPLIGPIDWEKHVMSIPGQSFIDWIIFGGESQYGCRPMDPEWVREGIKVCRKYRISPYVKQLGEVWAKANGAISRAASDPNEWPEDLRIQEYPIDLPVYFAKQKPDRKALQKWSTK